MKASTLEVTSSDMVPNKAYMAFPIRNAMHTESSQTSGTLLQEIE